MSSTRIAALVVAGMVLSSCSPYLAYNQPGRKELGVLTEGSHQSLVRAELGTPVWTGKDEQGSDIDIFQFVQGYSAGAKAARFVWHTAADVFSIGLWEIIGYPIESTYSGTKMNAVITYDAYQKVKSVRLQDIQGKAVLLEEKKEDQ